MRTLFEIAQQYEAIGYVCLPVNVTLGGKGKKQVHAPGKWNGRKFDQESDWEGYEGIAVNCRASGIVVVDIDTGHGKDGFAGLDRAGIGIERLETPGGVRTQSGGQHRLFRVGSVPVRDSVSKLADDVDIRAEGMLFVAPTTTAPGRSYQWLKAPVPVDDLPVFPDDLARRLAESVSKFTVEVGNYTTADVTDAQRDWALARIELKLSNIAEAGPGQRWEASKALPRIFGLAKTIGADLEPIGDKALAAFRESGGDDEHRFIGSIARAIRNAQPEDPLRWLPEDRQRSFWDTRPELRHIHDTALSRLAAPYAVLGALCVLALADVPPTWRIDTGIGDVHGGNVNFYAVLAAESGGGKGIATQVARSLWPSDVHSTEIGSGEALPKLFARKAKNDVGDYYTEQIRESVIIDAPEFGSLSASGARTGATLTQRLCNGFSGESLSFSVSDESKNVDVPANSYRLGVVTGIQYGNAGLLLSDHAKTTGLPQRFVWFPANVEPGDLPETVGHGAPEPLARHGFTRGPQLIEVCEEAKSAIREARRQSLIGNTNQPLDGHKAYARVKLAYALAVLNGHYSSVRSEDWELSGVVMEVSDTARHRAVDTLRRQDHRRAEASGKVDGIRKAAAADAEAAELHSRIAANVIRHLQDTPEGLPARGRHGLVRKLRSNHREHLDEVLADLIVDGTVVERGDLLALAT